MAVVLTKKILLLAPSLALAACGASLEAAPAAGAQVADTSKVDGVAAEADPADGDTPDETQALEECQAAAELLDRGDARAAVGRVDRCYAMMLRLPDDDEAVAQAKQDIRLLVAELVGRLYRAQPESSGGPLASWDLGLPLSDNDHVQREIKSFTTVEREQLLEGYRRAGRYRRMILAKLEAAGLPSQLAWLPLVESSFKVSALSRASALGLWQFISSTGLRYGLKRDAWVDERLDPEKATDAAVAYLTDLHRLFGDWPKALAAYNCGEGRISALQERAAGQYQDFWDLYAQLPGETRRYFPRLLAVLLIFADPPRYGLELPEPEPALEVETVRIERPVKLEQLEAALGLEAGTLAAHNPELRRNATPNRAYDLRVPASRGIDVPAAISTLAPYEPPREPEYVVHRVRSGETLSGIAELYHVGLSVLMRVNGIRKSHMIWPGQRLKVPVR